MKFTRCRSRVVPLLVDHVDTDQIIPARFLKTIERNGLGKNLFADWAKDPNFVLEREENQGLQILLAGQNFGCGSSREHAPWALLARGFRAIIAGSFADIFANNALKNGLLPVAPAPADYRQILELIARDPKVEIEVDLDDQLVRLPQGNLPFKVAPFARDCLLRGIDPLQYLLEHTPAIAEFESRQRDGGGGAHPDKRARHG